MAAGAPLLASVDDTSRGVARVSGPSRTPSLRSEVRTPPLRRKSATPSGSTPAGRYGDLRDARAPSTSSGTSAEVRRDARMLNTSQMLRAQPAATEVSQQRITLARLKAALRLPVGEESEGQERRPRRRNG